MTNNEIILAGKCIENFKYSHSVNGENFYSTKISVKRSSGNEDILNIVCSDRIIDTTYDITDENIIVSGSVRTRNEDGHLIVFVFADTINIIKENKYLYENTFKAEGYICKPSKPRETPMGRKILDQILAVNRKYGKTDYIPIIYWGRNADYVSALPVGSKIEINGRLQSRNYTRLDGYNNTAYEVSVSSVNIIE